MGGAVPAAAVGTLGRPYGKLVRAGPALFADDTPVKGCIRPRPGPKGNGIAPNRRELWKLTRGVTKRLWRGQAAALCGGYQFSVDRKGEASASAILSGYKGVVHADG